MLEVRGRSLLSIQASNSPTKDFDGRIQNVSRGGMCLLSPVPLLTATFVCCEIAMPDVPVAVPTLLQVKWTAKDQRTASHISGLRFVV